MPNGSVTRIRAAWGPVGARRRDTPKTGARRLPSTSLPARIAIVLVIAVGAVAVAGAWFAIGYLTVDAAREPARVNGAAGVEELRVVPVRLRAELGDGAPARLRPEPRPVRRRTATPATTVAAAAPVPSTGAGPAPAPASSAPPGASAPAAAAPAAPAPAAPAPAAPAPAPAAPAPSQDTGGYVGTVFDQSG
jgi:hypothetical protein